MTFEWLREHCADMLIFLGLLAGAIGVLSMTESGSFAFVICTYSAFMLILTGILSRVGIISGMSGSKQMIQLILFYASMIIIATALVTVFTNVTVEYKIVKQTNVGAPNNYAVGDAKSAPPAQMIGGLVEMITRPDAWMFFPLLLGGIALLSAAIVLGVLGE